MVFGISWPRALLEKKSSRGLISCIVAWSLKREVIRSQRKPELSVKTQDRAQSRREPVNLLLRLRRSRIERPMNMV